MGDYLSFNLNLNLPPAVHTGFLPAQQQRVPSRRGLPGPARRATCTAGSRRTRPFNVRGARNLPCVTVPGKRAPTVKMCESDENYVPLNDGYNWKGDPNATLSGQAVPQLPPGAATCASSAPPPGPAPPPIAAAEYDPASGTYVGPDGHVYTQADSGPWCHRGANMADDAAAPEGELTEDDFGDSPESRARRATVSPKRRTADVVDSDRRGRRRTLRRRGRAGASRSPGCRMSAWRPSLGLVAVLALGGPVRLARLPRVPVAHGGRRTQAVPSGRSSRAR